MQIPADLSDNDHCLVCRRTWQEAIGDHWQDELDRNVVQTNPKIELCLHCYKQCDQFLENRFFEGNSSKLPEHIGVIKQLSIYAYQWCRFCGAFNGPQTRLFSSENGVSICLDCYVELVHIHISLEAANPRFSHEIYQTHYQSKLKKIASFQASRPPLLTDEQRASQLKDRKTEITASHAFLLGQTIKKEHSNVGRIFHPGGITHQLQQATPEQPPVQPTTKTEEILGKRALVKEDTDEPPSQFTPVRRVRDIDLLKLHSREKEQPGDATGRSRPYVVGGTDVFGRNGPADHRREPEPKRAEPNPPPRTATLLGREVDTKNPVEIGDIERRSGLYVLGKPGMGKSTLLINLITQDIKTGNSIFFLDPHGEAIGKIFRTSQRLPLYVKDDRAYLLDPADEDYSFGINPLFCTDLSSRNARNAAFNKSYNIFKRVWESDNQWGLWLSLILRNTLPVLIETQQTLAEMPLFLNNRDFREYLLRQVRYNASSLDFWKHEFRPEQAQPALVRVRALLGEDDYVRDIVGQQNTTIDFRALTTDISGRFLFLRLPPNLNDETARFIGTIVTTELLHAIRARTGEDVENTYCLFVDEFQHFATDQFAEFINEGRKFGCATTIAHQERLGQFGENQKVLGATLACANKVLFQVTVKDARELAPEFAEKPVPLQTRLVPEMVVCKQPMWDLLHRGHKNPRVQELFRKFGQPVFDKLTGQKSYAEHLQLNRSGHFDEAMLYRDHAGLSGVAHENRLNASARREISHIALDRSEALLQEAMKQHGLAKETTDEIQLTLMNINSSRGNLKALEAWLVALMEGRAVCQPGDETFARCIASLVATPWVDYISPDPAYDLYIWLTYGDHYKERTIRHLDWNIDFLRKYFYPQTEAAYVQWIRKNRQKETVVTRPYLKKPIVIPATPPEKLEAELNEEREAFQRGYHIGRYTSGGEYIDNQWIPPGQYIKTTRKLLLPGCDVPLGVIPSSEIPLVRVFCETELREHNSPELFQRMDEAVEFCQLLAPTGKSHFSPERPICRKAGADRHNSGNVKPGPPDFNRTTPFHGVRQNHH